MALSALTLWEVRNGGNDTNGGGFVPGASGTDWSLQDAAQYSVTDAVTNGTTTITSATANFGTDVVGNILYVQGGTGSIAAGWYQIISRTNSTTIVVDRSTGLTAGTGATLKIGGAFATPGQAAALHVTDGAAIYIKYHASAYVFSTTTPNVAGGPINWPNFTNNRKVIGYDSTRTLANTDANRPTIQVPGAGVTTIVMLGVTGGSARGNVFRNLIADGQSKTSINGFTGTERGLFERCKAMNCTNGGFTSDVAINCEATGCSSVAAFNAITSINCVAHDNTVTGFSSNPYCINCISDTNTGASSDGFSDSSSGTSYIGCVAYNNGRDGFLTANAGSFVGGTRTWNCISYGNGRYGYNNANNWHSNHAAGSNTSGNQNGTANELTTIVSLSGDPFTNAAAGDFSLDNTSGEGAACRAAGHPGVFPGGLTTGYLDIGAVQHQDAGGGGGRSHILSGGAL
jgi:hypothetical protein